MEQGEAAPAGGAVAVVRPGVPARLQSIQILRAIAVMMVAAYHAFALLPDPIAARRAMPAVFYVGYAGVDLFFVISGFIIMHASEHWTGLADFAWKRLARILPLYWAATLLVAAMWMVMPALVPVRGGGIGPALAQSLLLVPEPYRPLLGVGWTLQHELIFYMVMGCTIAAGLRRHALAVVGALFAGGVWLHGSATPPGVWDYKLLSPYWIEFAFGIMAYRIARDGARLPSRWLVPLGGAVLMLAGSLVTPLLPADLEVPVVPAGPLGLLRVVGFGGASFLLLLGALGLERQVDRRRGADRLAVAIGEASFVIYLGHNPLLQVAAAASHRMHLGMGASLLMAAAAMAIVMATGLFLHRHLEQPLNAALHSMRSRRRPIGRSTVRPVEAGA